MVKIKYTGAGMLSRDINFSPTKTDGFYDVSEDDAEYFLETFPNQFTKIEAKKEDVPAKKARTPRTKKKSTDATEE